MIQIQERGISGSVKKGSSGKLRIRIIDAGEGSSGIYLPETLQLAESDRVFPAGVKIFLDHDTAEERATRPERSVKDLVGVTTSEAVWDEATQALEADAQVFGPHKEAIAEMAPHIGLSIRGQAEVAEATTPGGKPTITRISAIQSVDFVTEAGRGGKVLELLESASTPVLVRETVASEEDAALRAAVRAMAPGDREYAYLMDYDPDAGVAWYEVETSGVPTQIYQSTYTFTNGVVELTGSPVPGHMRRVFVPDRPTNPPADPAGVTESRKEPAAMASIQIEEAELTKLRATQSRVTELEESNATLIQERDEARRSARTSTVDAVLTEAFGDRDCFARRTLRESGLTAEEFSRDAFVTEATTAAAEYAAVNESAGTPRGLGGSPATTVQESKHSVDDIVGISRKG